MSAPSAYPTPRPLPPRPSLEYERKEERKLLRRLRAGEADVIARARALHPALSASHPERIRLADAQLVIAREYGFRSWPRLVRWFGDGERQLHADVQLHGDRGGSRASRRMIRWARVARRIASERLGWRSRDFDPLLEHDHPGRETCDPWRAQCPAASTASP